VELRVLGEVLAVDASREVGLRPVERRLLAALVVGRPSVVRYEALAEAVWGSRVPRSAKHSLQAHVRRVRESVGDGIISTANGGYQLGSGVTVDVDLFEAAIDAATSTSAAGAAARWQEALSLWRGIPFEEIGEWAPAESERVRLVELWHRAEEELCAAALATSPSPTVVAQAERLAHLEPLRERRWALLMAALHATGRRAGALRTFDRARRTLATELGISPGAELVRLHQVLLDDDDDTDPRLETRPRTGRLPTAVSSIVGRDELLAELGTHFGGGRLVTLTGPGGVGKTRLALEYASRRRAEVSGGGWWVDLAATRQSATVEPVIASTLGIAINIGTTREQIIGAIGDRHLLLVLDNCEHVLAAVAALVSDVLAVCPQLEVLATSREPLAVAGERTVGVRALLVDGSAVELFVARAREADPAFTADDSEALAAVSRRLDGLPLAIELAAARVRTLGLTELAACLDDRFDLLTATRRGPNTRHHTIRAALDWSYDLLDPTERVVFEQLAVFRGRFELEAVESVVSVSPGNAAITLASLVDKSMVVAEGAGRARFRLLEPLRQYANERLHHQPPRHLLRRAGRPVEPRTSRSERDRDRPTPR
jgi:predicted ATPase/DNA-binding SARP family transcriptional activator